MPTLNRIGKDKVVNHHHDVPFKLLNHKYGYHDGKESKEKTDSGNMIIHGDNLEALKSLLPKYEGKIKCIYIDPPYNTGNEGRVYNDNVTHPKIKKRLGEVVGKEGEDLTRHDKWLCMMYPRLKLLHKLLNDNGVIFISIDDNEQANLKLLCDEIFGSQNFGAMLSVEINPKGRKNQKFISGSNDYCLIYLKDKRNISFEKNIPKNAKDLSLDENGNLVHNSGKRVVVGENSFNKVVSDKNSDMHYSVYYNSELNEINIQKEDRINDVDKSLVKEGFKRFISYNEDTFIENTYSQKKFESLFKEQALSFKDGKIYEKNFSDTIRMKSILVNSEYEIYENGLKAKYKIDVKTTSANTELKNIFNTNETLFENPKNKEFIKLLITLINDNDCIILDSFAGSGTTAHAVMNLNKEDGGNRKFILIELMDYANDITAERVKRVAQGYGKGNNKVEGTGGSFDYYELGEPLFIEEDVLNENVGVSVLREYIRYTETHTDYPDTQTKNEYYLGRNNDTDYYFYYEKEQITTLNYEFLSTLEKTDSTQYLIYADICALSDDVLQTYNIIFKKIPRDISKI